MHICNSPEKIMCFKKNRQFAAICSPQFKCIRLTHSKERVKLNIQDTFSNVIRVQFQETKCLNINNQRGYDFSDKMLITHSSL